MRKPLPKLQMSLITFQELCVFVGALPITLVFSENPYNSKFMSPWPSARNSHYSMFPSLAPQGKFFMT